VECFFSEKFQFCKSLSIAYRYELEVNIGSIFPLWIDESRL